MTGLQAEQESSSYTAETGKTYHRPAVINTSKLIDFDDLEDQRKQLITECLRVAKENPWLKYQFGSAHPNQGGFDCSGAMYFVLQKLGYQVPRTSAGQYLWVQKAGKINHVRGRPENLQDKQFADLRPGDLVFWEGTYQPTDGRKVNITHVSIYLGKETKDGHPVMAGATKGRYYRGKRGDGYGVYDFKLPSKKSTSRVVGYGPPPGLIEATEVD